VYENSLFYKDSFTPFFYLKKAMLINKKPKKSVKKPGKTIIFFKLKIVGIID